MSRIDIVIFGSTGFTGKYGVEEMVKLSHRYPDITWGVAGRSKEKLENMLQDVSSKTGKDITCIRTIIADVTDQNSLEKMCSEAKVIANCCGPYFLVGEPVIQAAIASKTHYVDVAAEALFMESMKLKYDKKANDAGVYIVSACGADSIANDMGVLFLEKHFKGTLNSVEAYLNLEVPVGYADEIRKHGLMHETSWASLLSSIIYCDRLESIRKQIYPDSLPPPKARLQDRTIHIKDKHYCAKIPNPDESVINRTQRHLYATEHKHPVQFKHYYKFDSLIEAVLVYIGFFIINFLARFSFLTNFMLNHSKLFSFGMITEEGPPERMMDKTLLHSELYGKGWSDKDDGQPNKTMVAKVTMVNPYRVSALAQNIAALTILKDIDKMPGIGGVLTPGVAFRNTEIIDRLNEYEMKFQILKK